jgi:hypothetical protein
MTREKDSQDRAQSSELGAGVGFTFEDAVGAYFLSALLDEGYAPGIEDRTVSGVAFQQRSFGEPLDDLVADFRDATGNPARLSLQVKRSLTISAAASNHDFRDIVGKSWETFKKDEFRKQMDRVGAAVGEIARDRARALTRLCEMARESVDTSHFLARFADGGNAGAAVKAVKVDIESILTAVDGQQRTDAEIHEFLAHFVLLEFDFLHAGAVDPPELMTRLRNCLLPHHGDRAPLLWTTLRQTVRDSAGGSGQFDRVRLVRELARNYHLRGAPSLRSDLEKVTSLARAWVADIANDVTGTHLDRTAISDKLANLLEVSRFLQIKGLPGSGKSVVLRQRLEAELARGPVLFLKSGRLEGRGWASFAALNGLSNAPLESLLVEIGATGSKTLFIDGIDRIDKDHQAIVLDVLRTIFGSPRLHDWRILVSLRDTGIEPLRNWLGDVLGGISISTLDVEALDDEEAKLLAEAKPQLQGLLFGPRAVREIARRPFFAKILNQAYDAANTATDFQPQSEVDLVENWWLRGGYNATGQEALGRQRALIEIAKLQARHLSQPVRLSDLSWAAFQIVDQLVTDGIVRHVRQGLSIRFAHDILFEWACFHVLSDRDPEWLDEVHSCGEPPAVARVVELLSQYEYGNENTWTETLHRVAGSGMRPQWTRAWLLGPIGSAIFSAHENQFANAVTADNCRLLQKALVWFQAEKTTPNPGILAGELPQDQRARVADLLGWPSDFPGWRRFILFLIPRLDAIPANLYAEIVAVFEVWQNALAGIANPISSAIVTQCADWLREIDMRGSRYTTERTRWDSVDELGDFRTSLVNVVLRSAGSVPGATEEYLKRVIALDELRGEKFTSVVAFSPILAGTHPQLVVELTLKHLKEELPDDKAARERQEREASAQRRREALAKPEAERTERDKAIIAGGPSHWDFQQYSYHDWTRLCVHYDVHNFWPASPLREPFHSLFKSAPQHAIRLFNELCNHAITAWRQLHRHIRESPRPGTPLPLVIEFPWGTQEFWGGDREYLWYRAMGAPEPLECGFMALEDWCFAELERGRPVDDVIRQIVEGNQCVAILGVAVLLALHMNQVSETVFPLVTAQRLWHPDQYRMLQDLSGAVLHLAGFTKKTDLPHVDAIKASNARPARKQQLRWLVPLYVLSKDFGERTRAAIRAFKDNLPFQFEEQRSDPASRENLMQQAREYAELEDLANYRVRQLPDREGLVEITHVSPSASEPENLAKAERASLSLQQGNLWVFASKAFDNGRVDDAAKMQAAIELARKLDSDSLFTQSAGDEEQEMRRAAVAAIAAMMLAFRDGRNDEELIWARGVLKRAIGAPEIRSQFWSSQSVIPWDPGIFAARGLGADLRWRTAAEGAALELLSLVAHPLEMVSFVALGQTGTLWNFDAKLEWAALRLALTLCHIEPAGQLDQRGPNNPLHTPERARAALDAAVQYYRDGTGWPDLPLPPPAWVEVEDGRGRGRVDSGDFSDDDLADSDQTWGEPPTHWYSQYAGKVLHGIPFEEILASEAKEPLLTLVAKLLEWTKSKNSPPWVKKGRRDRESSRLFEWNHQLGATLGRLLGLLSLVETKARFLDPIFALEGEVCWALLAPLVSDYICRYIYDAPSVPKDAEELLELCLERFLKSSTFARDSYYGGEFHGFEEPRLVETLMFVSIERAPLAARFVNGSWSDIKLILPIIDRFIRAGGWAATVMVQFLTFCERSKDAYPAEMFADQILDVIGDGSKLLKGWHGTLIPARIAGLVQHFANRETPMVQELGQKLLRVLDLLVDMGDRRSAALQLSESFREIRIA